MQQLMYLYELIIIYAPYLAVMLPSKLQKDRRYIFQISIIFISF